MTLAFFINNHPTNCKASENQSYTMYRLFIVQVIRCNIKEAIHELPYHPHIQLSLLFLGSKLN